VDTFPEEFKRRKQKIKNLFINDYINYNKIPNVIKSAEYLLMPYPNKIEVLIRNLNVKKYISPLKMFEYLAAKRIIIASYQKSYDHILIDNFNAVLIKKNSIIEWKKRIKQILINKKKYKMLKKNSYETAKKFTWKKRAFKIIKFANE
jgi:glycosyltransferase involved in cell wall biosynthesis